MIKVAIAGGTGYTAGELLRILVNHPYVKIVSVLSTSMSGVKISEVHADLEGETELEFSEELPQEKSDSPDVIFLTIGHGLSRDYMCKIDLPGECRVIDLAADFRTDNVFGERNFVYGLTEMKKSEIAASHDIANPGCFATSILLALLPLAQNGWLKDEVHIHSITGSTGSGKSLRDTSHFSYRHANVSVYKPFEHQHLDEINHTISAIVESVPQINFVPLRGDFARGILTSLYTKTADDFDFNDYMSAYEKYYKNSPFVFLRQKSLSVKEVVNTNKAFIHLEIHKGYIHVTCVIDNLLKGASGQAVQNMNLMMGLEEDCGLRLKGSSF
jgi:N-acetyl-gamma-glutamyl-phosphate reductase